MKIVAGCGINVHHLAENRLMIEIEDGKITRKAKQQVKNMSVKKKLLKGLYSCLIHIY
jgi:biotin-(acetyl-CoA carboxylase) ligase